MALFFGDHEFFNVGEVQLGGVNVQEVYFGDQLIWPTGPPINLDAGYRLTQAGCIRLLQNGADLRLLQPGQPADAPGASPEAQSVLNRMCEITGAEQTAIINMVNCLVLNSLWDKVLNIWGLGLEGTDFLTSWKDSSGPGQTGDLIPSTSSAPAHIGAQHRVFFPANANYRTTNALDTFFTDSASGFFEYHDGWTSGDGSYNSDLFGAFDGAGNLYQCRWRGNLWRDYDLTMASSGPLPRPFEPVDDTRFGEDISGGGTDVGVLGGWTIEGVADHVLIRPGDDQRSAARTAGVMPAVQFQAPGTNPDGAVATGVGNQYVALWVMLSAPDITSSDVTSLRACMLQFARDIGLTNVPDT